MANKKRLIDADKIVNDISLYMTENAYLNDTPLDALKMVANWITDAPTVDAVPVVRCRDCIYAYRIDGPIEEYDCRKMSAFAKFFRPEHFCSYGERKEGAN